VLEEKWYSLSVAKNITGMKGIPGYKIIIYYREVYIT